MGHKKFAELFATFLSYFKYVQFTVWCMYQYSILRIFFRFVLSFSHKITVLPIWQRITAKQSVSQTLVHSDTGWWEVSGEEFTRHNKLLVDQDKYQHPLPHKHMQLHQGQAKAWILRLTFSDIHQWRQILSPIAFLWDLSSNSVCLFEKRTSEPGGMDLEFILLQNNHESTAKVSRSSCCCCINAGCMKKTVREQSLSLYPSLQTRYFFIHKSLKPWDCVESFSLIFNHIFCFHCFQSHTSQWCLQYTYLLVPILITFHLLPSHFGNEYGRHCLQHWSANTAEN